MKPFLEESVRENTISAGPTPHGYDIRLGDNWKKLVGFRHVRPGRKIPTEYDDYNTGKIPKDGITLYPRDCVLLESMEEFNLPENITGVILNKSSWARLFIYGPNTIIDGGFKGKLTLAFRNEGPWPVCIDKGMGLSHVIFHKSEGSVIQPYKGKYQNDKKVTGVK